MVRERKVDKHDRNEIFLTLLSIKLLMNFTNSRRLLCVSRLQRKLERLQLYCSHVAFIVATSMVPLLVTDIPVGE